MKRMLTMAVAAATIAVSLAASAGDASAQWRGRGWGWGPGVAAGILGGVLTTWVTFVPCFLFILLVQKHLVRGLTLGSLKD